MYTEDKTIYDILRKEKVKNVSLKNDNKKLLEMAKRQKELFLL